MKKTDEQLQQEVTEIRLICGWGFQKCGNEANSKNREIHYTLQ